jgi:uncharacterized protein (TIGR03437 family)
VGLIRRRILAHSFLFCQLNSNRRAALQSRGCVPASSGPDAVRLTHPFGTGRLARTLLFAGLAPWLVGLYLINVTVPEEPPRGEPVPVVLEGETVSVTASTLLFNRV